jgi:uncharacterized protein (DUF1684 family)
VTVADHAAAVEAMRAARIERLRSATGWLSLVGKAFLGEGVTTVGGAPDAGARLPEGAPPRVGEVRVRGKTVVFTPEPGVAIRCNGEPLTGPRVLRSDHEGRADALDVGGILLELMERGDALALRIRDTRVLPRPFGGIAMFPVEPSWALRARLVPHPAPLEVDLDYEGATGAVADRFVSPGDVVFEHDGAEHRLQAIYEDASQRRLFLLFRDATSGRESYGLGRFVYAPLPDASGELVLDFNLAILPGCAFTVYATCPLPQRANTLGLAVRAGEREYLGAPVGAETG